jgi:hypothetical protein
LAGFRAQDARQEAVDYAFGSNPPYGQALKQVCVL